MKEHGRLYLAVRTAVRVTFWGTVAVLLGLLLSYGDYLLNS